MVQEFHTVLDATQDTNLLSPEGLVHRLTRILDDLQQNPGPLPNNLWVEMVSPSAELFDELTRSLDKLNRVIKPRGFMDNIAHAAFRGMSGIQGELHPIQYQQDETDRNRLHLNINLSGLSHEDLEKFSIFLAQNAHRIPH